MDLSQRHPLYNQIYDIWKSIRLSHAGEEAVKREGVLYLPPTRAMQEDGVGKPNAAGEKNYQAYKTRAVFPDLVSAAVDAMVGLMHRRPPHIELPAQMESMRANATLEGESLEVLMRRINQEQLLTGRLGLMVDIPTSPQSNVLPYLVTYQAERIVNWDVEAYPDGREVLSLVVLDESADARVPGQTGWARKTVYRLLIAGQTAVDLGSPVGAVYAVGETNNSNELDIGSVLAPSLGGRVLERVPFVLIGARDLVPNPDTPPLLGVSRLSFTIYRGEADYRSSLFQQAQATLALVGAHDTGEGESQRLGSGAVIELPIGGDAKFVEVSGEGLGEMRTALENDYRRAAEAGAQLLEARGKSAESGDALRVRVAARTATLANVAMTGAEGLQSALRLAAEWRGLDPAKVIVTPNLDFAEDEFNTQDLVYFMDAKERGIPLSLESIHRFLKKHDVTEKEFEDEIEAIRKEKAMQKEILGPPTVANDPANQPKPAPGGTGRAGGPGA